MDKLLFVLGVQATWYVPQEKTDKNTKLRELVNKVDEPLMRIGELNRLLITCFFKAKELGYKEGNIYFQWPTNIRHFRNLSKTNVLGQYKCPKESILPIKFVEKGSVDYKDYNLIHLCDPNAFFEGSKPFIKPGDGNAVIRDSTAYDIYPHIYLKNTGERPVMNVEKDEQEKPYILIHKRDSTYSKQRNSDMRYVLPIVKKIKRKYKDKFKYVFTGDSHVGDPILSLFDEWHVPNGDNPNTLWKLVNNSSLVMGPSSSIIDSAIMLGVPLIYMNMPHIYRGRPTIESEDGWRFRNMPIGKTSISWMDPDKYMVLWGKDTIDMDKIYKFIDRYL